MKPATDGKTKWMRIQLVLLHSVALGCATNSGPGASFESGRSDPSAVHVPGDPFPPAKEGLTVQSSDAKLSYTLATLVADLERVTDAHLLVSIDTARLLAKVPLHLSRSLDVPRAKVWEVAESLLVANEFCLTLMSESEPIVLGVQSSTGQARTNVRNSAKYVSSSDLPVWSHHPAVLITTALELDSLDVRNLSNSMRQMFTETSTQQIVPGGNAYTIFLTGFGSSVAEMARMLQACNERERKRIAERRPVPGAMPSEQR